MDEYMKRSAGDMEPSLSEQLGIANQIIMNAGKEAKAKAIQAATQNAEAKATAIQAATQNAEAKATAIQGATQNAEAKATAIQAVQEATSMSRDM